MSMGSFGKLAGMIPGMPEYLIPKGGDEQSTARLRKFMVIMDSMNNTELDGKIDMHQKDDPKIESRIRRIAAGSGSHPNEVKMLLVTHKQFAGMVNKMGKSGMIGNKKAQSQQQQLAQQMRKNPNLINQRINQMDPRMLQQMGGREKVMAMMQSMAKGGNPGGTAGGGMPDFSAMMQGMGGGMPNMGGSMPPGMGGGFPNMGGSMPPGMGGGFPNSMPPGGFPSGMDMESVMRMAQSMGMAPPGGAPPNMGRR